MRRIICFGILVIFTFVLLSGCRKPISTINEADMSKINGNVIKGNNEFAFNIFKELNNEDRDSSIFISPFSISTALSMTYQGANGTTKEAMAKALRYKGIDIDALNDSYKKLLSCLKGTDSKVELNINNSIWIREGIDVKEDFLNTNKEIFDSHIKELDFSKRGSADEINNWIERSTKGKIQKMVDPQIPGDVVMYLINAIYFKGYWTDTFNKKQTFETDFYGENGKTEKIMMMSRKGDVEYGAGGDYQGIRLPYGDKKISMYCILPKEGTSINDYIKSLNYDKWKLIKESISLKEDVVVQIPRFKLEYGIKELNSSLTNLGMGEAFSSEANFSGITDGINISRVLHKAVIEVNEDGSTAAGATVVEMRESGAAMPMKFVANRPFLFAISDDETGAILFMGKLINTK